MAKGKHMKGLIARLAGEGKRKKGHRKHGRHGGRKVKGRK